MNLHTAGPAVTHHISHEKHLFVCASRKVIAHLFPYRAPRSVAAAQKPGFKCLQPITIRYDSFYSALCFFVVNEFTVPFDFNIFPLKVADDDAFMHVLGQTQHEGKTAEPFADITEIDLSPSAAIIKNRDAVSNDSLLNHLTGQTVLVIQFKCPCMDHHGPRFFTGAACLIYDPEWYAFAFQADSHRKSCRPCPHNQ